MLSKGMISVIRTDWAALRPSAASLADEFYARLFELDPELRSAFEKDVVEQKAVLISMVSAALAGLDNREVLIRAARALGHSGTTYRVKPRHYATVGMSFLWALKQVLGTTFGCENETAWMELYGFVVEAVRGVDVRGNAQLELNTVNLW